MRPGRFLTLLNAWAEKPCLLRIAVDAGAADGLHVAGVLRAYYSLRSLDGWALVPPTQHGGFTASRLIELPLREGRRHAVIASDDGPLLAFASARATFELRPLRDPLTAPPRRVRDGRYLYVGGRRRPAPEPWMWHPAR